MGRKSKFSESEMIAAARELERGARPTDVAKKYGVSLQTMARWRDRYAPTRSPASGDGAVRQLEDENVRLRNLVAQFALEIESLRSELSRVYGNGSNGAAHGSGVVGIVGGRRRPSSRPNAS